MLFLRTLIVSLLPLAALAAKKPASSVDKFETFHAKSLASPPLKLDDSKYSKLTVGPRDYSVAVLLTALESRFGCQLCREFQPEWDLLSKSWTKGDKKGNSRLIYGTLDFSDGKETFQSVSVFTILQNSMANKLRSLACKLLQFFCSSPLPLENTQLEMETQLDTTSQLGMEYHLPSVGGSSILTLY